MKDEILPPTKRIKTEIISETDGKASINEYVGWRVPSPNYKIPVITNNDDNQITAKEFFQTYVSQRKPIVLRNHFPDDLSDLQKWKTSNEILKALAGKEQVMVEQRTSTDDSFGRGKEVPLKFSEFLNLMENGDALHYLTTQDVECSEDGQPDLMAPFMKTLSSYFPLRPKLMGNLIPQNINIWMGHNKKDGASSGLHHDYHDNLYIVLRGKKLFRLYSPFDTEKMYTRGTLLKVHRNGRINYLGDETTAYGADLKSDTAAKTAKAKEYAEQMLIEAEKAVSEGKPGAMKDLEKAEEMLEEAMDALIDAERDEYDDPEEEECDLFTPKDGSDSEEMSEDDDFDDDLENSKNGGMDNAIKEPADIDGRRLVDKTVKNPDNFSTVPPHLLAKNTELTKEYPEILKANAAFCELEAGDILYLPASWFHEVTSFGQDKQNSEKSEKNLGHLAMNYWFHPPDNLDNFEHPYTTDFWPNDYKLRFEK